MKCYFISDGEPCLDRLESFWDGEKWGPGPRVAFTEKELPRILYRRRLDIGRMEYRQDFETIFALRPFVLKEIDVKGT